MAIEKLGYPVVSLLGWQAGFQTSSAHTSARIRRVQPNRIQKELDKKCIVVVSEGIKDKDGKWYILDYKLRGTNDYNPTLIEENSLQLILYYRLLTDENSLWDKEVEKETGIEVEYGGFYSLMDESFKVLWPQVQKTRSVNGFSLDIIKLDAEKRIERIVSNMKNGMITPDSSEENCKNCEYKRLCRGRFVAR